MSKEAIFNQREVSEILIFIKDNMLVRADIAEMATKSDIADMVRHSDIVDMVRQSDIADMVRKSDIADMATKTDVYKIVNGVKLELIDHISRKTAEVRGDLVMISRQIDYKTDVLTDTLAHKKVLTRREAEGIKNLSPFPRLARASSK